MKVMTVVGTRPEIIRLSAVIEKLDQHVDHTLVHTGQNYDYELSEIFFEEMGVRRPDEFLETGGQTLAGSLGAIFLGLERLISDVRPDAFLVLGDTNSCLSTIIAKRLQVPVYHMEAGNRSFDENVPEEINRRLIDHVSDFNLVYTEHARRNLLAEGLSPRRIHLTGSPMREVILRQRAKIEESDVLARLSLSPNDYFLASLHRQENVDSSSRLNRALESLSGLSQDYGMRVLLSSHPRTRSRFAGDLKRFPGVEFHTPWGFHDYSSLQMNSACVLSDSGSVSEESVILGFPAVTMRDAIERPEAQDAGSIVVTGLDKCQVAQGVEFALSTKSERDSPGEYLIENCSARVVSYILSTYHRHADWASLRPL